MRFQAATTQQADSLSQQQLTSCNTRCAPIPRQKHQADFFAHSLMFFSHPLTYSKGKQIS